MTLFDRLALAVRESIPVASELTLALTPSRSWECVVRAHGAQVARGVAAIDTTAVRLCARAFLAGRDEQSPHLAALRAEVLS